MIVPLLFALVAQASPEKLVTPVFPPLSSSVFQETVVTVEKSLEKGDFAAAAKQAQFLPKSTLTLAFDDSKVPPGMRIDYRAALVRATRDWRGVLVSIRQQGDIKVTFAPSLATDADTGSPANVATFFNDVPNQPRLEAVVGLRRANPLRQTTAQDLANDIRYIIGTYLGISKINLPGRAMNGSTPTEGARGITEREQACATANLAVAKTLRTAVEKKTKLGITGQADVYVDPASFQGTAIQGDELELPIQVTNRGSGMLAVTAEGDCGCIVPERTPPIGPGASTFVKAVFHTNEFVGAVERQIYLYTNDPQLPARAIPVKVQISPRYRFLMPGGNAVTVDKAGSNFDVFLTLPEGSENDMTVQNATVIGLDGGSVKVEPWKGRLADPELKEPERDRRGYRLSIKIPGNLPPGRSQVTLGVITNVPGFIDLTHTIFVQNGIVAMPEELFLGELAHRPKTSVVVLSRPGRPFKATAVKSSLKNFVATILPGGRTDEVRIQVTYDGKAPAGEIEGEVVVKTDDPAQPQVKIPIVGTSS